MDLSKQEAKWRDANVDKINTASKLLDKLNWPHVVHATAFGCGRNNIPVVAKILGYRPRACPHAADGIWRNRDGSLKAFILYERVQDVKL